MSNRFGLRTTELSPGVSYMCAYSRLVMGWPRARAVSEPPKKVALRKTYAERMAIYHAKRERITQAARQETPYMWERADWNKKARLDRVVAPKGRRPRPEPRMGKSPVQGLLTAYCDHFIKTGELSPEIAVKLREFVDAHKRPSRNPARVPAKHAAESSRRRRRNRHEHHSDGVAFDADQIPT